MPTPAADGLMDVPPGKVAAIVTSLEMTAAPAQIASTPPAGTHLEQVVRPDLDWYRALFRKVGEEWLWFSRLRLGDEALAAIIHDPNVAVHRLLVGGEEAGILELDFREPGACEITFFGLAPPFVGRGLGSHLMQQAVALAFARPVTRLWVHTCTLDHPAALQFYRRMGFRAFRQQVEIADDPRVKGELPVTAGRHVPIVS